MAFSKEIIDGYRSVLSSASVADACDLVIGKTCFLPPYIQNRINDKKIVGPAVTVLETKTLEMLPPQHALDIIDASDEGSVLVISGDVDLGDVAIWGGLMTAGAVANKFEATVLNGGVRDGAEIKRDYDYPVFAKCKVAGTTLGRYKTVAANIPVKIGDVTVRPGDLIFGDIDGVVVVPKEFAEPVLKMALSIDERETEQAKLIIKSGSLKEGLAKYGRI
ncbi:RraA family protein [Succinatimonas hippei]|uniref:RraA family protein n=1 Tax=Succinatimonas hippei TaxID=626938 RepID=UPI0026E95638|nr:RraA family protein [Succinatimonas hippei]